MARLLGLDIGTTACKGVVADEGGKVLWQGSRDYPIQTPKPGWTEQDPRDWARAVEELAKGAGEVDAMGFAGQMHGSVFLDRNGAPIRPALLWNDQRTAAEVRKMEDAISLRRIYEITCNPPLTGFQAPKILWLRENEPENFARVSKVLLPKDYVLLCLTGETCGEPSDASGTGLFDVPGRAWSGEMLDALGLPRSWFPEVKESWVAAGAGDQAAAAVGTGAVTPEIISVSLGTSGVVFASQETPAYDPQGRVHTFCHANGKWHSMSVMLSCGGAVRWARDTFGFGSYEEMTSLAANAKPSQVRFKPYLAGERSPHNDPTLRGSFQGLSLADGRAEVALAVFEGVTQGLLDGFNVLQTLRSVPGGVLRVTGGGARSDFWMQLLADRFGMAAARLEVDEGPAFGAAILAGVGAGVWPSVEHACKEVVRLGRVFEPSVC